MYLGVDVGSVSTKFAVVDDDKKVVESVYLYTEGDPIQAVKTGMRILARRLPRSAKIKAVGTTGSARHLIGILLNADTVKNEIISHAIGTLNFIPEAKTIIDIGGQDSKIIIIRNGIPVDFSMNTVCAAGTGSFLDHQAKRLGISIEEFGDYALRARTKVKIAGRCTVFAESDMVHKQQLGFSKEDLINGLCEAIVRNFLANVAKGKEILPPVIFQGGVAANKGVVEALRRELGMEVIVPQYYKVMGAIGIAILASETYAKNGGKTLFDFSLAEINFSTKGFECKGCPNNCEIVELWKDDLIIHRFGSRCGKWEIREVGTPIQNRAITPPK